MHLDVPVVNLPLPPVKCGKKLLLKGCLQPVIEAQQQIAPLDEPGRTARHGGGCENNKL